MLAFQLFNHRFTNIVNTTILSITNLLVSNAVCAQIIPDNSLNTKVNPIDGQQQITGGMELGNNLFHSFQEFSPQADFITHFNNSSNVENIFSRITGNSVSLIDGLIETNGNASLFILNPAGIIFGENAQLKIGGSFMTTTAESIIFEDGTKFNSQIDQSPPLLTVSIPSGLQYGNSPGNISSNNVEVIKLTVSSGENIALLGGNIELQNINIEAFSGNVEIGSVAENEIIGLSTINDVWKFNYEKVGKFNDITIQHQDSEIDTSGKLGRINLRGRNIVLNPGIELRNATNLDFEGDERGEISLVATNQINLRRILITSEVSGFDENFQPLTNPIKGNGGNITISAKNIKLDGSVISAVTLSEGAGGNIQINSSESIELSGFNQIFNQLFPSVISSSVNNSGDGGDIDINTGKLIVKDGAGINSLSFGTGDAGNIEINAHEFINISGNVTSRDFLGQETIVRSGLSASSGSEDSSVPFLGQSGKITVMTPSLSIKDGGEISVNNFGTANAGEIEIKSGELLLNSNSQILSTRASGNEGSITIDSSELILRDNAAIATTASGRGTGGNITLNADNIVLFDDSTINANAFEGSGGEITITTQGLFTQNNPVDVITASSQVEGLDGIVTINTPDINSKLETTEQRQSPLAAEESIYTGCNLGTDFSANKFSYIGRGGMRKGPFDSLESQEVIADLGLDDSGIQSAELELNHNSNHNNIEKSSSSITEATTWIINAKGKVELIAQGSDNVLPSECPFK